MSIRSVSLSALLAAGLVLMPATARADAGKGGSDNAGGSFNDSTRIELGVRYPGDKAYPFGTTRVSGPERGPYVQRCGWSATPNQWLGFFFPDNVKMTCVRYTDENTK
jgi:hypothetical protein